MAAHPTKTTPASIKVYKPASGAPEGPVVPQVTTSAAIQQELRPQQATLAPAVDSLVAKLASVPGFNLLGRDTQAENALVSFTFSTDLSQPCGATWYGTPGTRDASAIEINMGFAGPTTDLLDPQKLSSPAKYPTFRDPEGYTEPQIIRPDDPTTQDNAVSYIARSTTAICTLPQE